MSKVAPAHKGSNSLIRLAPNVHLAATRDGVIVSSANGCFQLSGHSSIRFISEILPVLYWPERADDSSAASPDWVRELGPQLEQAGIVCNSPNGVTPANLVTRESCVSVIRHTPLTERVIDRLSESGIATSESAAGSTLLLADLSGLNTWDSLQLTRDVLDTGCRSISIWRQGSETFYGPLTEPQQTACWNCCRLRFADSVSGDNDSIDDATTARVIADNIALAIRYPAVAAYGCVVVDDGMKASLHSVLPMPWCNVCGAAVRSGEPRPAPVTTSLHVPEDLRILADPRGGIVRRLFLFDGDGAEAPQVPICSSASIGPYRDENGSHAGFAGEGKGATREEAVRSAIGEGIERYSASRWSPSNLILASFAELGSGAFDPRHLVLYDEAQYAQEHFPFVPFDPNRPISWTAGRWLDTGESVWLPALATYMNFPAAREEQFGQVSSNGLAAGATLEDATLRALYELIERDAFLLYWLARRPAQRIAEDGCDPITERALREVERLGAGTELYLLDVGTRYPTVVCLGIGDGRSWPGATIGLGTHANIDVAVRRAVLEHGHCGTYIRRLMREGRHQDVRRPEDVVTGLDHSLYFVHPENSSALDAFRSCSEPAASLAELRSEYREGATLAACVSKLREAGIRTAAADVTSPDVALAPIRVVRAFGIFMQPIHFGNAWRRLKNPRLEAMLAGDAETMPHPIA
jgi:ribosomal protein S12 methylthiotransferase accessory factor